MKSATLILLLILGIMLNAVAPVQAVENAYESSLGIKHFKDNPKNPWRVLNVMMYHLARLEAEAQGPTAPTAVLLNELQNLNVMKDSAQVDALYQRIFASDNTYWGQPGNSFLDNLKNKRLPQVIKWGFDPQTIYLTDLGMAITQLGAGQVYDQGNSYVILEMPVDNFYYLAEEDPYGQYQITKVGRGPAAMVAAPSDPFGFRSGGPLEANFDPTLALHHQLDIIVPSEYPNLKNLHVTVTRIPAPSFVNGPNDPDYFTKPWDCDLFAFDIAAPNLDDFKLTDSAGGKWLELDLNYLVRHTDKDTANLITGQMIKEINVTDVTRRDGFDFRWFTASVGRLDYYDVGLRVANGGKEKVFYEDVTSKPRHFPLVLVDQERTPADTLVPMFKIGPVERGKENDFFTAVDGLLSNADTSEFDGMAYLMLFKPGDQLPKVRVDSSLNVYWNPEAAPSEAGVSYADYSKNYGHKLIKSIPLGSNQPRMFYTGNFTLPTSIDPGAYVLAIDFVGIDPTSRQMIDLGSGETKIMIK